jgi:hypothetical protein
MPFVAEGSYREETREWTDRVIGEKETAERVARPRRGRAAQYGPKSNSLVEPMIPKGGLVERRSGRIREIARAR